MKRKQFIHVTASVNDWVYWVGYTVNNSPLAALLARPKKMLYFIMEVSATEDCGVKMQFAVCFSSPSLFTYLLESQNEPIITILSE